MSARRGGGLPSGKEPARKRWVALIALTATIVAAVAGVLSYAGGENAPTAVLTAGGSFAGTFLLLITAAQFIRPDYKG